MESGEAGRIEIVPPAAEHHNSELLIEILSPHSICARPAPGGSLFKEVVISRENEIHW